MIDREGEFKFRPYIHTLSGVIPLSLYREDNRDIPLSQRDDLEPFATIMAMMVTPGILSYKLE